MTVVFFFRFSIDTSSKTVFFTNGTIIYKYTAFVNEDPDELYKTEHSVITGKGCVKLFERYLSIR